jgi:hypothetical protein
MRRGKRTSPRTAPPVVECAQKRSSHSRSKQTFSPFSLKIFHAIQGHALTGIRSHNSSSRTTGRLRGVRVSPPQELETSRHDSQGTCHGTVAGRRTSAGQRARASRSNQKYPVNDHQVGGRQIAVSPEFAGCIVQDELRLNELRDGNKLPGEFVRAVLNFRLRQ